MVMNVKKSPLKQLLLWIEQGTGINVYFSVYTVHDLLKDTVEMIQIK